MGRVKLSHCIIAAALALAVIIPRLSVAQRGKGEPGPVFGGGSTDPEEANCVKEFNRASFWPYKECQRIHCTAEIVPNKDLRADPALRKQIIDDIRESIRAQDNVGNHVIAHSDGAGAETDLMHPDAAHSKWWVKILIYRAEKFIHYPVGRDEYVIDLKAVREVKEARLTFCHSDGAVVCCKQSSDPYDPISDGQPSKGKKGDGKTSNGKKGNAKDLLSESTI